MQVKDVKDNGPDCWTLPPLQESDHKYTRGHVLVLGGAVMTGAARLAALAAQRVGAGVVTLAAPREAWPIYAASLMSVITRPLDGIDDWKWLLAERRVSAVLIGPGCEAGGELTAAMRAAAARHVPMVLDAGALQQLAQQPLLAEELATCPKVCLPHEGEYRKLAEGFGLPYDGNKLAHTRLLAEHLHATVLFKGAESILVAPDGAALRNHAHAPWLATAGSGDVLADMVAGFAAQGMDLFSATAAATWHHSRAAETFGRGMVAEDLIGAIPSVF